MAPASSQNRLAAIVTSEIGCIRCRNFFDGNEIIKSISAYMVIELAGVLLNINNNRSARRNRAAIGGIS